MRVADSGRARSRSRGRAGPAGQRVQHLGQVRVHALALAGREYTTSGRVPSRNYRTTSAYTGGARGGAAPSRFSLLPAPHMKEQGDGPHAFPTARCRHRSATAARCSGARCRPGLGSPPQHVLGGSRPFVRDEVVDFAGVEVGAEVRAERCHARRIAKHLAGERPVAARQAPWRSRPAATAPRASGARPRTASKLTPPDRRRAGAAPAVHAGPMPETTARASPARARRAAR